MASPFWAPGRIEDFLIAIAFVIVAWALFRFAPSPGRWVFSTLAWIAMVFSLLLFLAVACAP